MSSNGLKKHKEAHMFNLLDRLLESVGRPIEFVAETAFGIVRAMYYMVCVIVIAVMLLFAIGWALSWLSP